MNTRQARYAFLAVLLTLLLPAFAPIPAGAGDKSYGDVMAVVVSVYDGDTLTVDIPGWPAVVGDDIGVRVWGVDTPEMRDKNPEVKALAELARDWVRSVLPVGGEIILRNLRRDKYFRLNAEVWTKNGLDIGEALIKKGMAVRYDGGTKTEWRPP